MKTQIKRARQRGNKARVAELKAEIANKKLPRAAWPVWQAFIRMSARRGSAGFGPAPIGWGDIETYQRLTGAQLSPWDVSMIEMLDGLYLGQVAKSAPKPPAKES